MTDIPKRSKTPNDIGQSYDKLRAGTQNEFNENDKK